MFSTYLTFVSLPLAHYFFHFTSSSLQVLAKPTQLPKIPYIAQSLETVIMRFLLTAAMALVIAVASAAPSARRQSTNIDADILQYALTVNPF
jgi:hypothetical protein